jgi:hypothetical protein
MLRTVIVIFIASFMFTVVNLLLFLMGASVFITSRSQKNAMQKTFSLIA